MQHWSPARYRTLAGGVKLKTDHRSDFNIYVVVIYL